MQTLYIRQPRELDVQHHGPRMGSCYIVPQFLAGTRDMYRKMRAKSTDEGTGHSRIFLENNYTLSHNIPRSSTVVNGGTRLRGGWENHNSTGD